MRCQNFDLDTILIIIQIKYFKYYYYNNYNIVL